MDKSLWHDLLLLLLLLVLILLLLLLLLPLLLPPPLLLLLLLLLTLQPWVGLGLFNNSILLLSILYLRPLTNNFHPL